MFRQSVLDSVDLPPTFACHWTTGGRNATWVHMAGELDMATTPRLECALREAETVAELVVVDLRGLAFLDSSGLHAIFDAGARARQAGRRLVVVSGRPSVDRVLTLTAAADVLEIVELGASAPLGPAFREIPPPSPRTHEHGGDLI